MKQTFIAAVLAAGLAGSAEARQFFGSLRGVVTDSAGVRRSTTRTCWSAP